MPEEHLSPSADLKGRDPWLGLSRHTAARIALGRTGGSQRTAAVLDFRLAHARARDAVHARFEPDAVQAALQVAGIESFRLDSAVSDRVAYLARPDLGRRLSERSRALLEREALNWGKRDLALIISDGLSAGAAHASAVTVAAEVFRLVTEAKKILYPVFVVPLARVKIQDEIGEILVAAHAAILLGERPGLSAPDSLGAYVTANPRRERTDADRTCISNIREGGLPPAEGARMLAAAVGP